MLQINQKLHCSWFAQSNYMYYIPEIDPTSHLVTTLFSNLAVKWKVTAYLYPCNNIIVGNSLFVIHFCK